MIVTDDNINVELLIVPPKDTAELLVPNADIVTVLNENDDPAILPSTRSADELAAATLTVEVVMTSVQLVNEPIT